MKALPLSVETRRRVDAMFPENTRDGAAKLLEERCGESLPMIGGATPEALERVRFAVLKLSGGDFRKLKLQVEEANRDRRDTLVAAGFGCDVTAHRSWFPGATGKKS